MKWRTNGMFSNISWPYALEILDATGIPVGLAIYDYISEQCNMHTHQPFTRIMYQIVMKSTNVKSQNST